MIIVTVILDIDEEKLREHLKDEQNVSHPETHEVYAASIKDYLTGVVSSDLEYDGVGSLKDLSVCVS
jgi:hypothetical protein